MQQPSKLVWDRKKRTIGVKPVGNRIIVLARQGKDLPLRKAAQALVLSLRQPKSHWVGLLITAKSCKRQERRLHLTYSLPVACNV